MMEKVIAFALIITIAGFSNGKSLIPMPWPVDPHAGHDHQQGQHHDGMVEVVMEHLGKNTFQLNIRMCLITWLICVIFHVWMISCFCF